VSVDGRLVPFRQALIATGATPRVPNIPGLKEIDFLTSESVWGLQRLPRRLLVLGGGPVSCELGQAFAHLGAQVTIVTEGAGLLTHEDPDAARLVAASLTGAGVEILTGTTAARVRATEQPQAGVASLPNARELPFDAMLVATGRVPRTANLGLEAADVSVDDHGHVVVSPQLRTSNPWIWAAGDVTSLSHHTHTAGVHGSIVASNAILGLTRSVETTAVPRVTFTSPELAAVGVTTDSSRTPSGMRIITRDHAGLDRAVTEDDTRGFTRLVVDRKGRIVGATVVGPRAGETLGELTLAIHHGMRTRDVAAVTHAYPTFNDGVWNAAIEDVQRTLSSGLIGHAMRLLGVVRNRWVRLRQASHR